METADGWKPRKLDPDFEIISETDDADFFIVENQRANMSAPKCINKNLFPGQSQGTFFKVLAPRTAKTSSRSSLELKLDSLSRT